MAKFQIKTRDDWSSVDGTILASNVSLQDDWIIDAIDEPGQPSLQEIEVGESILARSVAGHYLTICRTV